jgi:hypothetical protein
MQAYALIFSYDALIKDKAIIAAEMLHEYDVKVSQSIGLCC